jgi:type II secretory pathway pseudopilin PulG
MKSEHESGMTLVEVMVSLGVTLFICFVVFSLLLDTQNTHLSENRKLDMNEAARSLEQFFSEQFRSAGAMLCLLNIPSFLGSAPPFSGIYPLNNSDYADGVILACGDIDAATLTDSAFHSGDTELGVRNCMDGSPPQWQEGDWGMVVRADGYYVFRVTSVGDSGMGTVLGVSGKPAYVSGLLECEHFRDESPSGLGGYPVGSPVIRLEYFSVFLVGEKAGQRQLFLVSDFGNAANGDILAVEPYFDEDENRQVGPVPLSTGVEDMQFEYVLDDGSNWNYASLTPFSDKKVAAVRVSIVVRSEEEKNKKESTGIRFAKPAMGDRPAVLLPVARYHYHYMNYEINLRNFNITNIGPH